jgi:hypothetical protein
MITLTEEQQKEAVEYYKKLINKRLADNSELFENKVPEWWERHLGTYSCKKVKDFPFEGSSDFHIPWAAFADTALESRFVAGVHSSDKIVEIEATTDDARLGARKAKDTFNMKLAKTMKLYDKICDMFQGLLVEGTRYLKIYPKQVEKTVWKYKALKQMAEGVSKFLGYDIEKTTNKLIQSKKTIKYTTVEWDDISVTDLIWEAGAKNLQDAQWVAHRIFLNSYQIKKKKKEGWINTDSIPAEVTKVRKGETEDIKNETLGDNFAMSAPENISLWEIWGAYPLKTGEKDENGEDIVEEKEMQFVIDTKNSILLWADENKFFDKRKPFVAIPCYRIAGKIRGQGLPQRTSILNDEFDTTHNITIDNAILCNALTLLYVPNKGFDPTKKKIKVGGAWPVAAVDGVVKKLELGNPSLDLYRLENFLSGMLEKMSMVTDYSMGQEAIQRPTVRGTLALIQEFNINVNFLLKNIQNGLAEAVKMTLQTLYEFMPQEGIPFINGSEEDVLRREDLENIDDMNIVVLADAVRAIQNIEVQKADTLLNRLGGDQTGEINTSELKRNFVEAVDHKLLDRVIRPPKELQALQQMQAEIAAKAQELQQREQDIILREGMAGAKEYEDELRAAGIPEDEIERKKDEYRKAFIKNKIGGGE